MRQALSETYTWLNFVLCKQHNDTSINGLDDLDGKTLGIINDPAAFQILENAGLRWGDNPKRDGMVAQLQSLIAFTDQTRIHDALAEGVVDAFAVDQPVFYWAATNTASKWHNRIEVIPENIPETPFYYAVAVAADKASIELLKNVNQFITEFCSTPERLDIETRWQGGVVDDTISYRDEDSDLFGLDELIALNS